MNSQKVKGRQAIYLRVICTDVQHVDIYLHLNKLKPCLRNRANSLLNDLSMHMGIALGRNDGGVANKINNF